MFRPGTILNDTWEIKRRIGQGSFCELFLARNIVDKDAPLVAVKAQNEDIEASIIRVEGDVIRSLNEIPSVPKFYFYGQHKGKDYIVMELLGGEDMSRVRNRARAASNANLVTLPAACFLSREILKSVKAIHEKGYIHRDIKPANFVRRDRLSSEFCMVDFGLARQYRDRDGNIRPKRESCEFRGTALYASPFIHEGEEQCPRDDLFSLIFVFCDLVCGKLPWSEAAKSKDKQKVASFKKQYLADPRRFLDWLRLQSEDADRLKRHTDGEPNFPPIAREQCLKIIRHLQSLRYEDVPDYELIDEAFRRTTNDYEGHDVSQIDYNYGGFDWLGGPDLLKGFGPSGNVGVQGQVDEKTDFIQLQKILCARCRVLGKDIQKSRRVLAASQLIKNQTVRYISTIVTTAILPVVTSAIISVSTDVDTATATAAVDDNNNNINNNGNNNDDDSNGLINNNNNNRNGLLNSNVNDIDYKVNSNEAFYNGNDNKNNNENNNNNNINNDNNDNHNNGSSMVDLSKSDMENELDNGAIATMISKVAEGEGQGEGQGQGGHSAMLIMNDVQEMKPLSLILDKTDYDDLASLFIDSASPVPAATSNTTLNTTVNTTSNAIPFDNLTPSGPQGYLTLNGSNTPGIVGSDTPGIIGLNTPGIVGSDTPGIVGANTPGIVGSDTPGIVGANTPGIVGSDTPGIVWSNSPGIIGSNTPGIVPINMPAPRCVDFSLALIWQDIATQALTVPDNYQQKEIFDLLDLLLRDAGRFFSCTLGESDSKWIQFLELQKVAYFFAEALNKRNSKSSRKDSNNHNHNHNHSYSSSNNSGSNSGFGSGSQRNSSTSGRSGSFGNHLPDQKKQKL